jgi:Cu+-exporting ATPase
LGETEADTTKLAEGGKTPVYIAADDTLIGVVAIADTIKPEAAEVMTKLRAMGLEPVMLTGDNRRTAEAIAQQVGISRIVADVLPQDKSAKIKKLQSEGLAVAMVGDGINDAPALAQADIGIAMGTGTDVAMESAGVTLLRGDLHGLLTTFNLSRATIRTIKQNLFWAFFYNVAMIPLAIIGWMHPVLAEIAMATSSVTVVSNANLLRRVDIRPSYLREAPQATEPEPLRQQVEAAA